MKKWVRVLEAGARTSAASAGPHLNGQGFVIDAAKGIVIEQQFVDEFRRKHPHIDLEARLKYFSRYFLKGPWLTFIECPEDYFRDKLDQDKTRAAASKPTSARKNSKRGELDAL